MILDDLNKFSEGQADVRNAGTYLCQKSIPLGAKGAAIADPPDFFVRVGTAFAGGTSVEFKLIMADDAALTTNVVVLKTSGALADSALTKDTIVWKDKLPQAISKAYLGIEAIGVGTHTAGDFDAGLSERVPMNL